ncbi:hypothetical protein HID58_082664, partial [Brassica napus]
AGCCSNTFSGSGGSDCQDRGRTSRKYFCFISNIRLKSCAISLIFNSILKPSWKIGSQQKTHFWKVCRCGNDLALRLMKEKRKGFQIILENKSLWFSLIKMNAHKTVTIPSYPAYEAGYSTTFAERVSGILGRQSFKRVDSVINVSA